jgi:hypothetical protein
MYEMMVQKQKQICLDRFDRLTTGSVSKKINRNSPVKKFQPPRTAMCFADPDKLQTVESEVRGTSSPKSVTSK